MRTLPLCLGALLFALGASGCVQFQPVSLYTGVEPTPAPERPRSLALAVEPVIYTDQNDDQIWFEEEIGCTQGEVTDEVVYEGRRAIKVSWDRNREGCEWAGFGIGWDNWVGKDLSEIIPYAAIQMRVRSTEGPMYGLPIVLTLEDYSGGMGFAYTGNRYFERSFIDDEWQTVTVPLSAFDMEIESLDPTNVKQLMFELQQSGSVYLDDIKLLFYEEPEQEPWLVEAPRPDPTALPIQLFADRFINDNGWGLVTDACQSVAIEEGAASEGTAALHLRWDLSPDACYEAAMGVSWDKWYPIDMTAIAERTAVQFDVRLPSGTATELPLRVGLEDYGRQLSLALVDARYTPSGQFTSEWQTVTIPLSDLQGIDRALAASPATVGDLPETQGGADLSNVKQLVVYMAGAGEVFLDNLRLVEDF
ncbi:MAG: glycan-binding surface protein [Rubricoccaceae bacterium]|nr:glycan-binding surface protein [Rubricoccaceae bacterium]